MTRTNVNSAGISAWKAPLVGFMANFFPNNQPSREEKTSKKLKELGELNPRELLPALKALPAEDRLAIAECPETSEGILDILSRSDNESESKIRIAANGNPNKKTLFL